MEICIIINTKCQGLLMNLEKTAVVVELAAVRGQFAAVHISLQPGRSQFAAVRISFRLRTAANWLRTGCELQPTGGEPAVNCDALERTGSKPAANCCLLAASWP